MNLEIVFSVELEQIFFEYEAEYLFKVVRWDRRTVVVVFVVCFAYYCDALILREMFVYKLVTSIDTKKAFCATSVFSIKLMKSVVSLRYDFCFSAIGCNKCLSIIKNSQRRTQIHSKSLKNRF